MSFLIRIIGPKENDETRPSSPDTQSLEEMSMEELIHQIFAEENIAYDNWSTSRNGKYFVVEFPVIGRAFAEKILDRLAYYNVGKTDDSNIMIIDPAVLVYKRPKDTGGRDIPAKHFQKFVNSLKSRLTVAQVYHAISSQGNFNFNYLCFLICAAIVADIALVTNSAASVFASMLLSPLMEPIMCIIFGLSLREKRMIKKGFRNTSVSLAICIIIGLTFGIPAHFISRFQEIAPYPTNEMSSRGQAKALIASVIVASASGVSVSFAILSNSLAAMIGNAISLSLLPPSVNCGQLFLLAVIALIDRPYVMKKTETLPENSTILVTMVQCKYRWIKDYDFLYVTNACDAPKEFAILGVVSFALTLLNIILIIITGYSVNRLKDLVPQSFTNDETRRFYTKDLKEVRDNYDCVHRLRAADLATHAYNEYLRLSLHPTEGEYTAQDTEEVTAEFQAVMEGIGQDPHLQTIGSWTHAGGKDFLAEFTRATEVLAQGTENIGVVGNGISGSAHPRISVASSTIMGGAGSLGSARIMHLRQLAATNDGDNEDSSEWQWSRPLPQSTDADLESAVSSSPDPYPSQAHLTYQRNQHQTRASFWKNLVNRRFSKVKLTPMPSLEETGVGNEVERDPTHWPSQRKSEEMKKVGLSQPSTGAALSCVPSSESDVSGSIGEAHPSSIGRSLRVSNASAIQQPLQQQQQQNHHQQISRSAHDVSSVISRNRSLASVSTISGRFEVTPTIKKPQSTKNLGSILDRSP